MMRSVEELLQPIRTVSYQGVFGERAQHNIYLFDQEMVRIGVRYFAEYHGRRFRTTRFTIYVPEEHSIAVAAVADRLRRF